MGIPDHLTCLLRNLYAGQEATIRTVHRTMDWFQVGKGVLQGSILSPCLFNFYNIDVDGEDRSIDEEVIKPNASATLNFLKNSTFHNIGYDAGSDLLPDNTKGGRVCSLVNPVDILIDGATFKDNKGKGIFFTPISGCKGGINHVHVYM